MRTTNPAMNAKIFDRAGSVADADRAMTVQGTVNKTGVLLALAVLSAAWVWTRYAGNPAGVQPWVLGGAIGGLILALVTAFKAPWAPFTTPLYAVLQGAFLGGISLIFELRYPGIVLPAVGLTFGTLACLLLAYTSRLIRVTEKFRMGVFAATGAIALLYIVSMVLGMFGKSIPFIHQGGVIGIGFSLVVVGVAALNLVLDFDFIERGAAGRAPKYMEWYGAFGLLVTLIWLYLEILRLLSKLRDRR